MNEVFLIGKIINEIKFDFMINSKHYAISRFKVELLDGEILNIRAYDKQADFAYRRLKIGDKVFIYGRLEQCDIAVEKIIIL